MYIYIYIYIYMYVYTKATEFEDHLLLNINRKKSGDVF